MPHSIDETLALVTAEGTTVDSTVALINSLRQSLADLLSGVVVPPETQAKIDALFDGITGNKDKLDAALAANVT